MDPKFGKPVPAGPYIPARVDLDQMPETPTRAAHHRRAHSETFFRFPDLDDMLVDSVFGDLVLPDEPPPLPDTRNDTKTAANHLRSLSVDADFFDGLNLDESQPAAGPRPRHRHSNSMDGYSSATSFEVDDYAKKAMANDKLAELALIDPKRAKRFDSVPCVDSLAIFVYTVFIDLSVGFLCVCVCLLVLAKSGKLIMKSQRQGHVAWLF